MENGNGKPVTRILQLATINEKSKINTTQNVNRNQSANTR